MNRLYDDGLKPNSMREKLQIDEKCLLWACDDKMYLGALNGIIGIVYMMLRSIDIIG